MTNGYETLTKNEGIIVRRRLSETPLVEESIIYLFELASRRSRFFILLFVFFLFLHHLGHIYFHVALQDVLNLGDEKRKSIFVAIRTLIKTTQLRELPPLNLQGFCRAPIVLPAFTIVEKLFNRRTDSNHSAKANA